MTQQELNDELFEAVINNDLDEVKYFVSRGADVNAKNENDSTPLHLAQDVEITKLLLDNGADINAQDEDGDTPLHVAQDEKIAEELIKHYADMHKKNYYGETPLHLMDTLELVKCLINHGVNPIEKDNEGIIPLEHFKKVLTNLNDGEHKKEIESIVEFLTGPTLNAKLINATEESDFNLVKELISNGADVNAKTFSGCPVLIYANSPTIAEFLIEHGADVNHINSCGITPLHDAIFADNIEIVRVLIKHGANVNSNTIPDDAEPLDNYADKLLYPRKAVTPLHWAVHKDTSIFAEILLENGADVNLVDATGQTPLHQVSNAKTAQLLIDHGADVNAIDSLGWTPLFYAQDVNIAKTLVENGADITIRDKYKCHALDMIENSMVEDLNETLPEYHKLQKIVNYLVPLYRANGLIHTQEEMNKILMQAVKDGNLCEIEESLILGADINSKDNYLQKAPLFFANDSKTVEYLIKHGADINTTDQEGYTPIMQSCYFPDPKLIETFIENGADVNAPTEDGFTPLLVAAGLGDLRTIKCLINHGANIKARDNYNSGALHFAVSHSQNIDIIKYLVSHGASVFIKNYNDETPLKFAQRRLEDESLSDEEEQNMESIIDYLKNVEQKILYKIAKHNAISTFFKAIEKGDIDQVKKIISDGADVNMTECDGETPLQRAVFYNHIEIVKLLIDNGANVNKSNDYGLTPLFFANLIDNIDIIKLLTDNGAIE